MITDITFQFRRNKKYFNKLLHKHHAFGDEYTTHLAQHLADDAALLKNLSDVVHILNIDPNRTNLLEYLTYIFGENTVTVTEKTKTTRTYFIRGLTIHEDDKIDQ